MQELKAEKPPESPAGSDPASRLMARLEEEGFTTDLTIKGMSGSALCSALKAQEATRSIPYVVVSGDRDIAEKARLCGADGFIGKPFEFNELLKLVNTYARTESRKAD